MFCLDFITLNIELDKSANNFLKYTANVFMVSDFNITYLFYTS